MNKLDQLKQMTTVVADTGDIESIGQYQPQDATTNPSLILKAAQMPAYQHLLEDAVRYGEQHQHDLSMVIDKLSVNFGREILRHVPGRVSTEVDARLSFDTQATVARARRIMDLYAQEEIGRARVLIKIAATWEGIEACRILEAEGIQCNLTLMFQFAQAVACADAKATLISPFVGRIYDWYKKHEGRDYIGDEDPGVLSVRKIYDYFRAHDVETIVMGASFRNIGQIEALAGCDYLTIAPTLLDELQNASGELPQKLSLEAAKAQSIERVDMDEKAFRWQMSQDPMATEKLHEGIRLFARDIETLEHTLTS